MSGNPENCNVLLLPLGLAREGRALTTALPLAGSGLAFASCEVTILSGQRQLQRVVLPTDGVLAWAEAQAPDHREALEARLRALTAPRAAFAGLSMERPRIMGIINVTPDSFSDGGDRLDAGVAVEAGRRMLEEGADLLDVGGESTRPGSEPVAVEEELRRVLPVVRALAAEGAKVSIDSRHARVMAEAAAAGAAVINDVTALTGDPESLRVASASGLPVILMHMRGEPRSMQKDPRYGDVTAEIFAYLEKRVAACREAGIPLERIAVDPGIGFGKTIGHNLTLLDRLAAFQGLGCPVLLGASRKRFIGTLGQAEEPKDRLAGSLACALAGAERGVQMIRVHDVAETRQAINLQQAIAAAAEA
jgi:dihydropteroate synthase